MALEISFCFLPHNPEGNRRCEWEQPPAQSKAKRQKLTCDVSAINPAGVRRDELRQQLREDRLGSVTADYADSQEPGQLE